MAEWEDELERWLKPFLDRLGHKTRQRMCPLYVAGLIGPGDRKSVQPMAERVASGAAVCPLAEFASTAVSRIPAARTRPLQFAMFDLAKFRRPSKRLELAVVELIDEILAPAPDRRDLDGSQTQLYGPVLDTNAPVG